MSLRLETSAVLPDRPVRLRPAAVAVGDVGEAGRFEVAGRSYVLPRIEIAGARVNGLPLIRIGLFAGVHGDEPAGCVALWRWAQELRSDPRRAAGYHLMIYPECNPTGLEDGTRHNRAGLDLNREFWRGSEQPEVRILETELRRHRFEGIVTLHADDTCDGLYGYAHGSVLNEALLEPALAAAAAVLPRDARARIDGFAARSGIICECFRGVLAAPPEQHPQPFDLIFETPAGAPEDRQVEAALIALRTILNEYRGFLAQGENL